MPSFDRPADAVIAPSPWVLRWAALIRPGGQILDLAAGHGRHTRALAGQGYKVTAADVDCSGLADLRGNGMVEVVETDLETGLWPWPAAQFDGIVVANYLHRPHFPHLIAGLATGGVLIVETFGQGNERHGRPRNPDFLLAPGELLAAFGGALEIVAYEHGVETIPRAGEGPPSINSAPSRAAVRQRLCAVRGSGPYPLQPA